MTDPATDSAIEAAREAFLATIPVEAFAEDAEADTGEAVEVAAEVEGEPALEAEADATEPAAEEVAAEDKPSEPSPEPESKGYRRLLAREAKLVEEKKALAAEKAALEADRAALVEFRKVKDKLKADPIGFLRGAGMSQQEILDTLAEAHHLDLGDLAPPEVRANLAVKRAERIALEAEEKLRISEQTREQQAFIRDYQTGIQSFVSTGLTEFPHLATMAAAGKPVAQAIWQTAVELGSANPQAPAPTYAQVAAHLNQQLAELASVVTAAAPTANAASATPTVPASKPVLRNSATQTQPGPAPEPKNETYAEYTERIRQTALAKHGLNRR